MCILFSHPQVFETRKILLSKDVGRKIVIFCKTADSAKYLNKALETRQQCPIKTYLFHEQLDHLRNANTLRLWSEDASSTPIIVSDLAAIEPARCTDAIILFDLPTLSRITFVNR